MKLFTPNTDHFNNYYDKARYLLAWRISLVFAIVFAILVPIFSLSSINALIPGATALVVALVSLSFLYITKNYSPLYWVYAISGTIIVHYAINTVHEFTHFVDFMWISAIIFLSFIGLGKRVGLVFVIIHLIGIFCFYIFSLNTHIEALQPRTNIELIGTFIEMLLAMTSISYLLTQYIIFKNYSEKELKKINQKLIDKNHENIALIQEVHHRVKNNLQIITSLLRLQKHEIADESKVKFDEAINRVMAMSIIHKKLYQTEDLSKIDVQAYIKELINEIIISLSTNNNVHTNINTNIQFIGLKTIVPLGLLINELLSNSFKHAFIDNQQSIININITSLNTESELEMIYSDNGSWVEPKESSSKFGLELIQTLTEQLEGVVNREASQYTFRLKNLDI